MIELEGGQVPADDGYGRGYHASGQSPGSRCRRCRIAGHRYGAPPGAQVEAFDVRPAVRKQIPEPRRNIFGAQGQAEEAEDARGYAKEMSADHQKRETEMLKKHAIAADIVITTALVPGKRAPVLITRDIVEAISPVRYWWTGRGDRRKL